VATEIEKVFMDPDVCNAQHIAPNLGQQFLGWRSRRGSG
jgi:hypothetical protein